MTEYFDRPMDFEFKGFSANIKLFHGLHQQLFLNLARTDEKTGIHYQYCLFCLACKRIPPQCAWEIGKLTYSVSKDKFRICDTEQSVEIDCAGFRICAPFIEKEYFTNGTWPKSIYTSSSDGEKVSFIKTAS